MKVNQIDRVLIIHSIKLLSHYIRSTSSYMDRLRWRVEIVIHSISLYMRRFFMVRVIFILIPVLILLIVRSSYLIRVQVLSVRVYHTFGGFRQILWV